MQKFILISGTLLLSVILTAPLFASAAETRPKWIQDLEKSCERKALQDCLNLAVAYSRGDYLEKKITKDPALAKGYIDRSLELGTNNCKQGNFKSCHLLALLYFEGGLITTDYPKAIEYGNKACAGGLKEACEWLRDSGL